jgi:hypothetical protein
MMPRKPASRKNAVGDRARETGEARPVGAELIAHHDAGDDAHAEGDCEDLRPEQAKIFVVRLTGFQPAPFEDGDEAGEADAERRKHDVKRDGERKLDAGEIECRYCGVHERFVREGRLGGLRASTGVGAHCGEQMAQA